MRQGAATLGAAARRGRAARGQSLVEFALAAPLLFILFLLLFEGARLGASAAMVTQAARAAAHAGSFAVVTTDAPLRAAGSAGVPLLGVLPASAFTIVPAGTDEGGPGRSPGGSIAVTVHVDYTVLPIFAPLLGSTLRLTSTTTMPVE